MGIEMPKEVGDHIEGGLVIHKEKMAGITFYITEDSRNGMYRLFSVSRKRPLQECHSEETDPYFSREEAVEGLAREQANLEQILKNKRDAMPTPRQLSFLFQKKIPIPIDLTWGQASDLIEEWIVQGKRDKQNKESKRFNGLQVGMRVYQHFKAWFPSRADGVEKWQTNRGEIIKLTSNNQGSTYAYVKFDGSNCVSRVGVSTLRKEVEGEPLQSTVNLSIPTSSKRYGEKVSHPQYGEGTILHAGQTLANVQFQDDKRMVALTDLELQENKPVEKKRE